MAHDIQMAKEDKIKVLICEDEIIVSMDIMFMMEDLGYDVVGQCASVRDGLKILENEQPDAAILDVRVKDGEVFPLARELEKRGTQIIFHSGHALEDQISASFPEAAFCPKPTNGRLLGNCLMELLAKNADENAERSH